MSKTSAAEAGAQPALHRRPEGLLHPELKRGEADVLEMHQERLVENHQHEPKGQNGGGQAVENKGSEMPGVLA